MLEEWREVIGYEGYNEVSNIGRVRTMDRFIKNRLGAVRFYKSRIITPFTEKHGHQTVSLNRHNIKITCLVHILVLEAFIGKRPKGLVTRHLDGNPSNNKPCNLKWGTPSENQQDRKTHGTYHYGEACVQAKLTNKQAEQIRKRYVRGSSDNGLKSLADDYNVSIQIISYIINKITYVARAYTGD